MPDTEVQLIYLFKIMNINDQSTSYNIYLNLTEKEMNDTDETDDGDGDNSTTIIDPGN